MKTYTQEQLASRIANLRSVENVMSKYAFLTYYKRFDEALGEALVCARKGAHPYYKR